MVEIAQFFCSTLTGGRPDVKEGPEEILHRRDAEDAEKRKRRKRKNNHKGTKKRRRKTVLYATASEGNDG
jgi:hypothetical protein